MISAKKLHGDRQPVRPRLKVNPADFVDTTVQAYAERIADDYNYILKQRVIPGLPNLGDLKLRELRVLVTVDYFENPLTPIDISEILRYDPATVSRAVAKLVKLGKLIRERNMHDTRSVYLILTPEGQTLATDYAEKIQSVFGELEAQLTHGLTDEEKMESLTTIVKLNKRSMTLRQLADGRRPMPF